MALDQRKSLFGAIRFVLLALYFGILSLSQAAEIGFIESFSLAEDREKALEQLIPGTPEYYYYHCLFLQNEGRYQEVEEVLRRWRIRNPRVTTERRRILNRQALLTYEEDPESTLKYLTNELKLKFDHARNRSIDTSFPTALDPALIDRHDLLKKSFKRHRNLNGIQQNALDWVIQEELNPEQLRHLLKRIHHPDLPNLTELIARDLKRNPKPSFGSYDIHTRLLQDQLIELKNLKPDLLDNRVFVEQYLSHLRPFLFEDSGNNPEVRSAYLDRLWAFVKDLNAHFNSLKANVLYHRLKHDLSEGTLNRERFIQYLGIPRSISYASPRFSQSVRDRGFAADLNRSFGSLMDMPPVRNDRPLVRDYLLEFFKSAKNRKDYSPFISESFLKTVFAESRIVNGIGDMEEWYSLLNDPRKYQELKDRVDMDFDDANPVYFKKDDVIRLDLHIKNVNRLLVKVFHLNAFNYYHESGREIPADINLDGLIANEEFAFTYSESSFRRVRRQFEFPQLRDSGVYVIEFIGNGKSSRAVIRKGRLRFLERISVAGQVFTILDEENRHLESASLWLSGKEYRADDTGVITIPFTKEPKSQTLILQNGEQAELVSIHHQAEEYHLQAGFHIDRESLLRGRNATILLRPVLQQSGIPAPISFLSNPVVEVMTIDREGITARKEFRNFELSDDRETKVEIRIPENLVVLNLALKGSVKKIDGSGEINLRQSKNFPINRIESTHDLEDLHLARTAEGYVLYILGKTGESVSKSVVRLRLKHRDFNDPVSVTLQSDSKGRIELGNLDEIREVYAELPNRENRVWRLRTPAQDQRITSTFHVRVGDPILIPLINSYHPLENLNVSLLRVKGNSARPHQQFNAHVKEESGWLRIIDLPQGSFELKVPYLHYLFSIKVTDGEDKLGYYLGETRFFQKNPSAPLRLEAEVRSEKTLQIQVNPNLPDTRIHVFGHRFLPEFSALDSLNVRRDPSKHQVRFAKRFSRYLEGRKLGDELRYILDRRSALKFPGNMLRRPELLLNPWAIRQTEAEDLRSIAGDDWLTEAEDLGRKLAGLVSSAGGSEPIKQGAFSNLDFLAAAAEVYLNLIPDEEGRLEISLPADGAHQAYEVIAIHRDQIVSQSVYLPERPLVVRDLRLPKSLDGEKHFAENKRITETTAGQVLELKSAGTGEMEVFDSLTKVFQLFQTLSGNSTLQDFQFILDWPDLSDEERLKKYSEFACHELNFFIYRKDPEFFRAVVLPYLANKREKTFLDRFLLNADLTMYQQPWQYVRLNTAERCFLAERLESEHPMTLSFLQDAFDSQTPDLEKWNRLFQTGLRIGRMENASRRSAMGGGGGLGGGGGFGGGGGAFFGEPLEQAQAANRTSGMAARYGLVKSSLGIDADGLRRSSVRFRTATLADSKRKKALAPAAKPGLGRGRARGSIDKRLASDLARRQTIRSYYREAEKTQAWVENHYWKLLKDQQSTGLVGINSFWVDYIRRDRSDIFLSPAIAEAAGSFSEMMLALSVLDLPIRIDQPAFTVQEDGSGIRFDSPAITFHKQIREVSVSDEEQNPVLVNQAIFKPRARSGRKAAAKSLDYTNGDLQMRTLYGCEIVVTNPTGEDRKLDILLQIPEGAVPVQNGFYTRSRYVQVLPHTTHRITYFFYFPVPGEFMHFPVHVSSNGNPVASAQTRTITVLESLTEKDTQSWEYIAQEGSMEQVIEFLNIKNLKDLPLDLVAWRMSKKSSYLAITEVLRNRHYFNHDIWAYSLLHKEPNGIEETLLHQNRFINQCGLSLDSPLLQIDPVARGFYQHIEYRPLYNPRIHTFGSKRQILNEQFFLQYKQFLEILSYRSELNQEDLLAIVYYLLLQDRVEEGLHFFNRIDGNSPVSKIQFDYLKAYLSFYLSEPEEARRIAESYRDYSVIKWREKFLQILNQVDEIQGEKSLITDEKNRDQRQTQLASTEPDFEFSVDSGKVRLDYQNLHEVSVSYYLMDLEFLFSRNPFLQQDDQRFTFIRPNRMESLSLPEGRATFSFDLPSDFQNRNILIEIQGGGKRRTQTFYSNDLNVQIVENFGQVKVIHRNSGKPLSKVYVKVYARAENDDIKFHKDGYTDLRGRFDYASLNDGQIGQVSQFAMLILSENNGAVVREFDPPQR